MTDEPKLPRELSDEPVPVVFGDVRLPAGTIYINGKELGKVSHMDIVPATGGIVKGPMPVRIGGDPLMEEAADLIFTQGDLLDHGDAVPSIGETFNCKTVIPDADDVSKPLDFARDDREVDMRITRLHDPVTPKTAPGTTAKRFAAVTDKMSKSMKAMLGCGGKVVQSGTPMTFDKEYFDHMRNLGDRIASRIGPPPPFGGARVFGVDTGTDDEPESTLDERIAEAKTGGGDEDTWWDASRERGAQAPEPEPLDLDGIFGVPSHRV